MFDNQSKSFVRLLNNDLEKEIEEVLIFLLTNNPRNKKKATKRFPLTGYVLANRKAP